MQIEKKLARLIYPEFRFGKTTMQEARELVGMGVGGFCLYGGSRDEITQTLRVLRSEASHPLIFAADYENGAGQWIKEGTLLPSNMAIAATDDPSFAKRKAVITAVEGAAMGVDWIFAPVVDLAEEHNNPIVNLRAFSDETSKTALFASAYLEGLDSIGSISSIKHFPGHGSTVADSHLTLPEVKKSLPQLEEKELKPFEALISRADSVMVGHLNVAALDPDNITSFSRKVIYDLLRSKMSFKGVIITDALSMKAISDEGKAGVKALLAGADILLVPEDPFKLFEALKKAFAAGSLTEELIDSALARQEKMRMKLPKDFFSRYDLDRIGCREHRDFVSEAAFKAQVQVKDDYFKRKSVYYWEDGDKSAGLKGEVFLSELRRFGVEIKQSAQEADCCLIASFSRPKAYSGKINLAEEDRKSIEGILALKKPSAMVCFGSPFSADSYLERLNALICSFSDLPEFQKAAAAGFLHKADLSGKMPVRLGI